MAGEEAYASEYLEAAERLTAAGYVHYEVSNFARPGRQSRHNGAYWTGAAYLGLGPSAHSYLPPRRIWNVRDFGAYAKRIQESGTAVDGEEKLDDAAAELERSWLGLRTADGLFLRNSAEYTMARRWQREGWATVEGQRLRLTPGGWLLLDRLAVEFADGLKSPDAALTFKG
jgi:oxygen-independent coproporphyrinogen-3 oxidase